MPNITGSLVLLGILLFIVYRILQALNSQTQSGSETSGKMKGGNVFRLPNRAKPAIPFTITLSPIEEADSPFKDKAAANEIETELTDRGGLKLIGDFSVNEMPGYFLRAFTHPTTSMIGIIYLDPNERIWLNLLTEYADGRIITTTSAEEGAVNPRRPRGMPLYIHSGLPTDQLLRRHKLETRFPEKVAPLPPEQFIEFFAANYKKLREGLAQKEKEKAAKEGSTAPPAPPIPFPTKWGSEEAGDKEEEGAPSATQLKSWLDAIYSAVPVPKEAKAQFQRSLVWVLENASMNTIADTIAEYAEVSVDEVAGGRWVIRSESGAEDIIEPGKLKGPALFDKINASLPSGKRFSKLPVQISGVAFYSRESVQA